MAQRAGTHREGEPLEAFKARVLAEPIEATTGVVVFGGLLLGVPELHLDL